MKEYTSCAGASVTKCQCYINYDGKTGKNSIEQCPLCKAAPALLAACKECSITFLGLVEGSIGGQAMKKVKAAIERGGG